MNTADVRNTDAGQGGFLDHRASGHPACLVRRLDGGILDESEILGSLPEEVRVGLPRSGGVGGGINENQEKQPSYVN